MTVMEDRKKHAYFQDKYRRSSNFGKMDVDNKPSAEQDGTIELREEEAKDAKEIRTTVNKLLKDSKKSE